MFRSIRMTRRLWRAARVLGAYDVLPPNEWAEFTPPLIYSNGSRSKLVFMVEAEPAAAASLKPGQPLDVRFGAAPA